MTSLLDIAPPEVACKNIPIVRGDRTDILTVYGLTALDIAKLIRRFPKFRLAAAGKDLSEDDLLDMGLDVSPVIISMGLRSYEEDTVNLVTERLTVDEQSVMIEAIMSLTNPEAPKKGGPFKRARGGRRDATSGREAAGISP
jgi:hypothetical protein